MGALEPPTPRASAKASKSSVHAAQTPSFCDQGTPSPVRGLLVTAVGGHAVSKPMARSGRYREVRTPGRRLGRIWDAQDSCGAAAWKLEA